MNHKKLFNRSTLSIALALLSSQAYAAGFQLNEYSITGLGRAFSGEGAVADNAAVGSRNPAAMMLFDRPSFSGGLTYIKPQVDISGTSPSNNSLKADDVAPWEVIPNLHFIYPVNDRWALGTSLTSNFGLSTKFDDDYPAGPIAGETKLTTVNLNLSAAYRLTEQFSFGLGFNALYADAKLIRYSGEPFSLLGSTNKEITRMTGDEWGYGWNAGVLYEWSKDSRFALTYRSKIDVDFDGKYRGIVSGYQDVPASLELNLPEIWEFSAYQRIAPQWALHYGAAYTTWHRFKELKATSQSGSVLFQKDEMFRDAYRLAIGTTYYHDDNWTFRTGVAFDKSPVPKKYRSISVPDQDRIWFSAGTTYAFNKDMSVDLGLSYMHGMKVDITEASPNILSSTTDYNFSAKGKAWLLGVGFNYTF